MSRNAGVFCVLLCSVFQCLIVTGEEPNAITRGLIGHWPLVKDGKDVSGNGHHLQGKGIAWSNSDGKSASSHGAEFSGRHASFERTSQPEINVGRGDFSLAMWVHVDAATDDVPGDIISKYDSAARRGFHLGVKTNTGVTFNQANYRQLQFGIDQDRVTDWRDCGKPGKNSLLSFGLIAHKGRLFAGTCEPGDGDSGHVYQYSHGTTWIDLGAPAPSNAITSMAAWNGELFVGTGKYRVTGSALNESNNQNLGGEVFQYGGTSADGVTMWNRIGGSLMCGPAGQAQRAEAVSGLVVFQNQLYAGSLYKPAGLFRFQEAEGWIDVGVPDGKRVEALAVYNGHLYASSYDGGHVYRFDGRSWTDLGQLGDADLNTQTYSFAIFEGDLYAGTWRSGKVYRFEEDASSNDGSPRFRWIDVGRLGEELEVMGMLVHNGRLMAGTLPLAEVYQFQRGRSAAEGASWKRITQLDSTPDVKYRRAWTMAEYQGQLFCSTLPNGHVHACEVGKLVSWDEEFPTGWHHVAAVKSGGKLLLFVDGKLKSSSTDFNPEDFDLSNDQPLRIGSGPNDDFRGRLRDVRLFRRALTANEVATLARE